MKNLLQRIRHLLGFALLITPLAWAVTFNGLSIQVVPQLSFDTRTVQTDAPAANQMSRSMGSGAYTLAARSPYSRGAITYTSSAPAVATVDRTTGRVSPLAVGATVITATQAALAPYPAATASYTLTLTGTQVVYGAWTLADRTFGDAPFDVSTSPPVSTPTHPSPITYATDTPSVVSVSTTGAVSILKAGTATIVARQAATASFAQGEVRASFNVAQAVPTLQWAPQSMVLGSQALTLSPPTTPNTDPAATFSYTVADTTIATVTGNRVQALKAGSTRITARQAAVANYQTAAIEVDLTVTPAQVAITGLTDISRTIDAQTPGNNVVQLAAQAQLPAGSAPAAITYTVSPAGVATVSGNQLTLVGIGSATVTAALAADANGQHGAATATASLTVSGADPGLTMGAQNRSMNGQLTFMPVWATASAGAVTVDIVAHPASPNPAAVATVSGNQITLIGAGTVTLRLTQAAQGLYAADTAETTLTVSDQPRAATVLAVPEQPNLVKLTTDAAFKLAATSTSSAPIVVTSSQPAVAEVSVIDSQTLTIKGAGTTTLTVSQVATETHIAASVTVTLQVQITPTLTFNAIDKAFGDAAFVPVIATNSSGTPQFTVADTTIASVNAQGQVSLLKAGQTTVTVQIPANGNFAAASATATLNVAAVNPNLAIQAMQKVKGTGGFDPVTSSASPAPRIFTIVGDPAVATVVNNQVVPLAAGTVTVQVTQAAAGNYLGATAQATLTVTDVPVTPTTPAATLSVDPKVYGDAPFTPTLTTLSDGARTYGSSNTAVATVDAATGLVTIVGAGQTTLSVSVAATSLFNATSATAVVTVAQRPADLTLRDFIRKLSEGAGQLTVGSRSSGAINITVGDATVATVQGSGTNWMVTPLKAGNTQLTATQAPDANHLEGTAVAQVQVSVAPQATIQWAPPTSWAIGTATTFQLPQPTSNSGGAFTFGSSNPLVATVSGDEVTVVAAGTTALTATQAAQGAYAQTQVSVNLVVQAQPATVPLPQTAQTTEKRLGDAPFRVASAPGSPVDTATWAVSYASSNTSVLTVAGNVVTLVGAGDADITATWTSPAPVQTVVVTHPVRVLKAFSGTQMNFTSPLEMAFSAAAFTPSFSTASSAPIVLSSRDRGVVGFSTDGTSILPLAASTAVIDVTQAETATHLGFTGAFTLKLNAGTPVLSDFPSRRYTYDPLMTQVTMVAPKTNSPAPFTYTSSDETVGKVLSGVFTMFKPGTTVITASQPATSGYAAGQVSATYTVEGAPTGLRFTPPALTAVVGQPFFVDVATSSPQPREFTSLQPDVATVNLTTGLVTPLKAGLVTIKATQTALGVHAAGEAFLEMTVLPVAGLTFPNQTAQMGQPLTLVYQTQSTGAVTATITSANAATVATLNGLQLTPVGAGTVTIKLEQAATASHGAATALATVTVQATNTTINGLPPFLAKTFPATQTFDLPAPTSSNPAPFVFASTDPLVATVAAKGDGSATVTVLGTGITQLRVSQPASGAWAATLALVQLTVTADPTAPLALADRSLPYGSADFSLDAQVVGVTGPVTRYTSSNPAVAAVLPDGFTVNIRDVGEATLSAEQNGTVVATARLTVTKADQTIDFPGQTIVMAPGQRPTVPLQAAASSGGAVTFSIDNTGIANRWGAIGSDGRTLWVMWTRGTGSTGNVDIVATQAGNDRYNPVSVTSTFNLTFNSPTPWIEVVEAFPTTVTAGERHTARVNHNIARRIGMQGFVMRLPATAANTMQCNTVSSTDSAFPDAALQVTAEFLGGTGQCDFRVADNSDTWVTTLGSIASAEPPPPSTFVWPEVVVVFGDTAGVPAAPFAFNYDNQRVWTANPAVATVSPEFPDAQTGQPRVYGVSVGSTTLYGNANNARQSTTVRVLPATPTINGWTDDLALSLVQGPQALAAPVSNSEAAFTYSVEPPDLATVVNGMITPSRPGEGFVVVTQAAGGNYTGASMKRKLWVQPGLLKLDFGAASRVYGDAPFALLLPAAVRADRPYTVTSSQTGVVQAAANGAEVGITIQGAGVSTITVVQTAVQSGGTSDVTATATVTIDKAVPKLSFTYLNRLELLQPQCYDVIDVKLPQLNQGELTHVPGLTQWLDAKMDSLSPGALSFAVDNYYITSSNGQLLLQGALGPRRAGTAGVIRSLVIQQAETANFYGATITLPDSIRVRSQTDLPPTCAA